jgi:hypothetical protein
VVCYVQLVREMLICWHNSAAGTSRIVADGVVPGGKSGNV